MRFISSTNQENIQNRTDGSEKETEEDLPNYSFPQQDIIPNCKEDKVIMVSSLNSCKQFTINISQALQHYSLHGWHRRLRQPLLSYYKSHCNSDSVNSARLILCERTIYSPSRSLCLHPGIWFIIG